MCSFTIPFKGSAADLVARAKAAIEAAGGTFSGNTSKGSFKITNPVTIEGDYTISGQNISIDITKKPFFVSCARIESELKKLLGSGDAVAAVSSSVTSHADDILAHIDAPHHLAARAASTRGCITILGMIEVCYSISSDELSITAELKTPVGSVHLGSVTLTPSHTTAALGGSVAGFKAEVSFTADFAKASLRICGSVCAPFAGCKRGCTSVHF